MSTLRVPEYFFENRSFTCKQLDTFHVIAYSTRSKQIDIPITLTKNMLVYLISGEKRITDAWGKCFTIKPAQAAFVKSGTYFMSELALPYEAFLLYYDDEIINRFMDKYTPELAFDTDVSTVVFHPESLFEQSLTVIRRAFDTDTLTPDILRLKFEELFLHLLHSSQHEAFVALLYGVGKSALRRKIETHIDSIHGIDDMVRLSALSPQAFRKAFESEFKTTPKKWWDEQRLTKANLLLKTTNKNVSQISLESGFENLSWFSKRYKMHFGISPSDTRNQKNNRV